MYSFIYITAKDEPEAQKIANVLLKKKLIACANLFPIKSFYKWKGKLEKTNEVGLIVKTQRKLVLRVIEEVKKLHSYEVPCIIALSIEAGNKDFLNWIKEETQN